MVVPSDLHLCSLTPDLEEQRESPTTKCTATAAGGGRKSLPSLSLSRFGRSFFIETSRQNKQNTTNRGKQETRKPKKRGERRKSTVAKKSKLNRRIEEYFCKQNFHFDGRLSTIYYHQSLSNSRSVTARTVLSVGFIAVCIEPLGPFTGQATQERGSVGRQKNKNKSQISPIKYPKIGAKISKS